MADFSIALSDGGVMPAKGFGTWRAGPGETKIAVLEALRAGFRHIDCAAIYGNEVEVGEAIKEYLSEQDAVKRADLWITSKVWNTMHGHVREAIDQTLQDLQLDYLDLYLIHFPVSMAYGGSARDLNVPKGADGHILLEKVSTEQTWRAMEALVDDRLARHIGVSNFHVMQLTDIMTYARIAPVVNQIEMHVFFPQQDPVAIARHLGVAVTAYCPLGGGFESRNVIENPIVKDVAASIDRTPAQVALKWCLQKGVSVLSKSKTPSRIRENWNIDDFVLSDADMAKLDTLDMGAGGTIDLVKGFWGWSYTA